MIKHSKVSGKQDGADPALIQPSDWNDDHTIDDQLNLPMVTPASPGADSVGVFARKIAGRMVPAFVGPSGLDSAIQATLSRNKIGWVQPTGNATTLSAMGLTLAATGAATAISVATTNLAASMRKLEYLVTTAATTAVAGFRSSAAQFWRGNAPGLGGFTYICRFGTATGMSNAAKRLWVGMRSGTGAFTDVNPSTQTNAIGVGYDAGDTNFQIMHNDASGNATRLDTGIAVPGADRADCYEIALFCPPNGSSVGVEFTNLTTGVVFTATLATDIPAANVLLAPGGYASVGGTSFVCGIALYSMYLETDY